MRLSVSKKVCLLPLILGLATITGCAGPKVASDLLSQTGKEAQPAVNNSIVIETSINPRINNYEGLDETVKESIDLALLSANLFGQDSSSPYRIKAHIEEASQAAWSFGSFEGKLRINYSVFDGQNNGILEESIYTEAGSDKSYFSGAKRHRRARAVNISKNVLEFVEVLRSRLDG